jgi:hypothetical protein
MTQDGMITLSEAYHYAYKETLSHTENTIGGPQHPMYNIQMSGKGDVIMTDIRKSSSVLVIGKNIFGRVFIHNQENVLVVEINKPFGRDIEIGLEKGKYRVINIRKGDIYESRIALAEGMSYQLKINQLKETKKVYALARGNITFQPGKMKNRFQVEFLGGYSTLNPADLNLRAQFESEHRQFVDYRYINMKNDGNIIRYSKNFEGEFKKIKNAIPRGFRFKYFLNNSISISLGFNYISREKTSNIRNRYTIDDIVDNIYRHYILDDEVSPYTLSAAGYIPAIGIHFSRKLTRSTEIEGYLTAGPLFARCSYFIDYQSAPLSDEGVIVDKYYWDVGVIEEKGKGTGFSLEGGARMNFNIGKNFALFLEGGYAYQMVNNMSGPGYHTYNYETETWEGDWAIKEVYLDGQWGSRYFQFPSNAWGMEEDYVYYKIRDFKLDLSGFRMKIGISYRF